MHFEHLLCMLYIWSFIIGITNNEGATNDADAHDDIFETHFEAGTEQWGSLSNSSDVIEIEPQTSQISVEEELTLINVCTGE